MLPCNEKPSAYASYWPLDLADYRTVRNKIDFLINHPVCGIQLQQQKMDQVLAGPRLSDLVLGPPAWRVLRPRAPEVGV